MAKSFTQPICHSTRMELFVDGVLPDRATVVVAAILVPEAKAEIVAYAHIPGNSIA